MTLSADWRAHGADCIIARTAPACLSRQDMPRLLSGHAAAVPTDAHD